MNWILSPDRSIEYAYRYEYRMCASLLDEFDCPTGPSTLHIYLHKYPIVRRTPKGMWISVYGDQKFVLLTARKQFATLTIEEAKQSFIARKERYLQILNARAAQVERALDLIQAKRCWPGDSIQGESSHAVGF